ncbi:MAG: YbaB/EbfC family nucleoid-associated protein [Candidatus Dasytiphilus stammeri]
MFKKNELENLINQAQHMQEKMQKIQKEISELKFKGESGAGLVTIIIDGKYHCNRVTIDPSLRNDHIEIFEDLIAAAFNDAVRRLRQVHKEKMSDLSNLTVPLPYNFSF